MTSYRTNFEGNKHYEEVYECHSCGKQYDSYNQLNHPSEDTGGFCWCGSDHIKVLVHKTIYQELCIDESASIDDVLETALELERWEVIPHTIRINGGNDE